MKPVREYKRSADIIRDLRKEDIGYGYTSLYKIGPRQPGELVRSSIILDTAENYFCCAFHEIGYFQMNPELDKYWPYLLKLVLNKSIKKGYTQCSTINSEEYKLLNEALSEVGFEPVIQVKSNYGKYKIILWQWFKSND